MSAGETLPDLVAVMKRLLAPDGCPWDREQTLETLKPFLLEETYEVLEAMEPEQAKEHCEELGDLLMQIVFQAELRTQEGAFGIDDVIRGIAAKLQRRHPHVFGETKLETSEQVLEQWGKIKETEKQRRTLDGIPFAMPALARAFRISERAAAVGFDWPDVTGSRAKIAEELEELDQAISAGEPDAIREELGDLLFAVVNLARKLETDAEGALRGAIDKFVTRFEFIEDRLKELGRGPRQSSLTEMDAFWNDAKRGAKP